MHINISRYVLITSGIGGRSQIGTKNLGGMIITKNNLVPTGAIVQFTNAPDVGLYFGTASGEYLRAVFYFGFVSKNITSPQTLNFWFWNNDVATASLIFGAQGPYLLSTFTSISAGELTLTLGGFTHTLTGINLSGAGSLAAVATDIQTAINAYSAGGAAWTAATVSYNATGLGSFNLISGATGTDVIAVTVSMSEDLAGPLGWLTGAILSNGSSVQTLTQDLAALVTVSNNFGSFCLGFTSSQTEQNIIDAATWNYGLTPNVQFMFCWQVSAANASSWRAAVAGIGGQTGTIASAIATEYPEMCPMILMAATDYTQPNSVQNYMYQQFNLTPSVTTDAAANTYDALLLNYYGQTQTSGQLIQFYQRGVMSGGQLVDPTDQNVYANEIWFKDALADALMNLLLALPQIPASNKGVALILSQLQSIINQALNNGTIEVGKTLTNTQQLYISQITGSTTAWQQVQNIGYWVGVVIEPYVSNSVTQYKAVYTLVYSKDDVIRLITGSDVLI